MLISLLNGNSKEIDVDLITSHTLLARDWRVSFRDSKYMHIVVAIAITVTDQSIISSEIVKHVGSSG